MNPIDGSISLRLWNKRQERMDRAKKMERKNMYDLAKECGGIFGVKYIEPKFDETDDRVFRHIVEELLQDLEKYYGNHFMELLFRDQMKSSIEHFFIQKGKGKPNDSYFEDEYTEKKVRSIMDRWLTQFPENDHVDDFQMYEMTS